jgi:hypothetical protein
MALTSALFYYSIQAYFYFTNQLELSKIQKFTLSTYILSLWCLLLSIYYTLYPSVAYPLLVYRLLLVAIPSFMFGSMCILYTEGIRIADTRGYHSPQLVSRTSAGWEITRYGRKYSLWLLGLVRSPRYHVDTDSIRAGRDIHTYYHHRDMNINSRNDAIGVEIEMTSSHLYPQEISV